MKVNMYDKIEINKKAKKDTKFATVMIVICIIVIFLIALFAWIFSFRYRFSDFIEKFSACASYANEEDSLIVKMDGKSFKITDENLSSIFNYIVLNGPGRESKKVPDGEPIVFEYGNGAVMRFFSVPADKYSQSSGLFIQYEDTYGNSYSYISYKMTLDTIVTRYLLYDNIEI